MYEWLINWLNAFGLDIALTGYIAASVIVLVLLLAAWLSHFIASRLFISAITRLVKQTKTEWDDIIVEKGVLNRLTRIVPAIVIYFFAYLPFPGQTTLVQFIQRITQGYMILVTVSVVEALLSAVNEIYQTYDISKSKPIKGYLSVAKIFIFIVGAVLVITTLLDESPLAILSGIGALSAVILLVFKDSILGLVAGIQLSANNMVRLGDWIEMPQYGADGDVVDITLQSIKVQNWDKTITTIPIYSLVSSSFKNWRGMTESGGRRIKRAINIDMNSIRFCNEEMLERYKRFKAVQDHLDRKEAELAEANKEIEVDEAFLVNGRHLTNIGIFRAYLEAYLHRHPGISDSMTFLVRQLPPGTSGLPIEIYVFSKIQAWAEYEGVQSDIFDHVLAVLPEFGLRVYQSPSSADIEKLNLTDRG